MVNLSHFKNDKVILSERGSQEDFSLTNILVFSFI